MGSDYDYFGRTHSDRPLRKPSLHSRLQGGKLCYDFVLDMIMGLYGKIVSPNNHLNGKMEFVESLYMLLFYIKLKRVEGCM